MKALPEPLRSQLLQVLQEPAAEREILARHARTCAILALDFSGMTRRSAAEGIVYALAICAAAMDVLLPDLQRHGGELVTMEADTIFVLFPSPGQAVEAALDAQRALGRFNAERTGTIGDGTRRDPLHGSIGLGFGEVLPIEGHDVFGVEVNHAFILGEDIAAPGEVLATQAFLAALRVPPPGVGTFRAPEEREAEAGFGFHVVMDARD